MNPIIKKNWPDLQLDFHILAPQLPQTSRQQILQNQKTLVGFFAWFSVWLVGWVFWGVWKFFCQLSSCSPHWWYRDTTRSRCRSYHGLMWNHPWEQADVRFTLPSVRHLLNYCPGTVSNLPSPSPQVLLAAHECHNSLCCAHQQITWAGTCGLLPGKWPGKSPLVWAQQQRRAQAV